MFGVVRFPSPNGIESHAMQLRNQAIVHFTDHSEAQVVRLANPRYATEESDYRVVCKKSGCSCMQV